MSSHPKIDMMSFTGSTRAGKQRRPSWGAETVKKVALELGGKSANVMLDDLSTNEGFAEGSRQTVSARHS
jgi:aldehyde dehydrogenase (NAD+)